MNSKIIWSIIVLFSTIIQKPQEESSQKIEDIEQSNPDEEPAPKVNTPSTQKTIDKPV